MKTMRLFVFAISIGMLRFGNFGGDWFDPTYALPVSPKPHLLTTTWGAVKK